MELRDLKEKINGGKSIKLPIVFLYEDTDFIACQYAEGIGKVNNAEIVYTDSFDKVSSTTDAFLNNDIIYVCKCASLNYAKEPPENSIVITKNIFKASQNIFTKYTVNIPKIESWQLVDYIKTRCPGLHINTVNWFMHNYEDIYRLTSEIDKIALFAPEIQDYIFGEMYKEGALNIPEVDASYGRLVTTLQKKDYRALVDLLLHQHLEKEPMTIVAFLQVGFRNLIKVWINRFPTVNNTGLYYKVLDELKALPRVYNKEQLTGIFIMLSNLEREIREGLFPQESALKYTLARILDGGNIKNGRKITD